jgi:hypothetical protein
VRVTEAGWTDSVDFLVGFLGLDDGLIYIYRGSYQAGWSRHLFFNV